jgi:sugar/nucleoside kinase (ribokinase family)
MANKNLKMLCIGKATQDVFLKSDEFDPHIEGKIAYTHLPLGAKLDVDDVTFATGGNATNAAVTFARQGLHAQFMWALGHETASQAIMDALDKENVDTSLVYLNDSFKASYSTILLSRSGERTILNFHGTVLAANGGQLNLDAIGSADWVYVSSLGSMELLERIITKAAAHGTKVAFNPAGSELAHPEKLKSLLEDVEVLLLNKEEMQLLVEGSTTEELARHGTNYCPVVVVSDGPKGVVATDGKTLVRGGLYEDVPVIDRTGAGDAFGSGFVSMYARGHDLKDCVVFASANSTSVVQYIGAKAGILPAHAELHDMPLHVMPF